MRHTTCVWADCLITYYLYDADGKPITDARAHILATDNEVRQAALAQMSALPMASGRSAAYWIILAQTVLRAKVRR